MLSRVKISTYKLKKIIRHFSLDIEASKTAILVSVNRKTVNRFYMMFRKLIYMQRMNELQLLTGDIECDESYFGAKRVRGRRGKLKRGRGTLKQPVFGIFERNGQVYTEIIPNCKKKTLQDIILGKVELSSAIHTDGWRGYDGLVDVGYDKHLRVNHGANEFSKGNGCHINGIESFWSFVKRRFNNLNSVPKKYFHLHLKESEWRWNKTYDALEKDIWKLIQQTH
jgi:transposase